MELLVLIGQRKERYEGQYSPEALAVIDEIGNDENPDYMREQLQAQTESGEFDALAVVRLNVSSTAIKGILYPESKIVVATVSGGL